MRDGEKEKGIPSTDLLPNWQSWLDIRQDQAWSQESPSKSLTCVHGSENLTHPLLISHIMNRELEGKWSKWSTSQNSSGMPAPQAKTAYFTTVPAVTTWKIVKRDHISKYFKYPSSIWLFKVEKGIEDI